MIKKFSYKFLSALFVLVLITSTSCNKWLDLKPEDGIIRNNYWQTKEQLQAAVVGCYSSLMNPDLTYKFFVWGELRADMVSLTSTVNVDEQNIVNGNILSTNKLSSWATVYQTINYCNTVIKFGPDVLNADKTLTEVQLNAYLAEAKSIRALMYFWLVRTFGEVPLQLDATASDQDVVQQAKSSQAAVMAQVFDDLSFAATYAPTTYGTTAMDKGRITKYSVYAIQADAYLWMDKYAECIAACDKIINSGQFALVQPLDQTSWASTVLFRGNSTESIFEIQFDAQKQNGWFSLMSNTNRRFIGSPKVMDQFYGVDLTDATKKDIRGDGASIRAADQVLTKHVGVYSGTNLNLVSNSTSYNHWFFYRYPDVLLLKAEALAYTSKGQDALDIVKQIRDRAQAIQLTEESPSPTDTQAIVRYILNERAREFAFEGKRWFDILRVAKRNNYQMLDVIIEVVAGAAPADRQQSIINKYKDIRSHYLPIAQTELTANKNLVQNPFYQ